MIEAGEIFVPHGSKKGRGQARVVVYRIHKDGHVFYDGLANHSGGGAICHGYASSARFLERWERVGRMRFEGAYQLYSKQRNKTARARRLLRHVAPTGKSFVRETRRRVMTDFDRDTKIVIREAMIALSEKMGRIDGDPIYELFSTGGEGTWSHAIVSGHIANLRVEVDLDEPPLSMGTWTEAVRRFNEARSQGLRGETLLAESERQVASPSRPTAAELEDLFRPEDPLGQD